MNDLSNNGNAFPQVTTPMTGFNMAGAMPPQKKKFNKKLLILSGAALLVVVVLVVVLLLIPSRFEKAKKEALDIAGQISSDGKNSFTIDTYPFEDTNMDSKLIAVLAPDAEKDALKAIKHVNEELGFDDSLYDQMMETSALMGRQSESNDKYKVTWTYHPREGLEVTYKKK